MSITGALSSLGDDGSRLDEAIIRKLYKASQDDIIRRTELSL